MGHLNLLKDDASVDKADYAVSISLIKSGNLCRIVMHIGLVEHLYCGVALRCKLLMIGLGSSHNGERDHQGNKNKKVSHLYYLLILSLSD